ncbi:MAG: hypothetical protein N2F24_12175, partial [Deltaproteobacteria bacterium]
ISSDQNTPVSKWDWTQWKEYWGPKQERTDLPPPVLWNRFPTTPVSDHAPADFILRPGKENPARGAATNGISDAGFQDFALPAPHPPTSTAGTENGL